jgi:hypothetical protein
MAFARKCVERGGVGWLDSHASIRRPRIESTAFGSGARMKARGRDRSGSMNGGVRRGAAGVLAMPKRDREYGDDH